MRLKFYSPMFLFLLISFCLAGAAVAQPGASVQVVAPAGQACSPGQTLSYNFVINYTNPVMPSPGYFNLTLSSNKWPAILPSGSSIMVNPGTPGSVTALVSVPSGASFGDTDTLTLTAAFSTLVGRDAVTSTVGTVISGSMAGDVNGDGSIDLSDYHLIGFPGGTPVDPDPGSVFCPGAEYLYDARIFQYKGGRYVEYAPGSSTPLSPVGPGQGYWMVTGHTRQLSVDTFPVSSTEPVLVVLRPGWNIVGYPFTGAMALESVLVRTAAADIPIGSQTTVLVENQAWGYASSYFGVLSAASDLGLQPWNAYWFQNVSAGNVTLVFNPTSVITKRAALGAARAKPAASIRGLSFTLAGKSSKYRDRTLFLGVHPSALDGPDLMDSSSPPVLSDQIPRIYVDHTSDWNKRKGRYAVDVRREGNYPKRYNLVMEVPDSNSATRYLLKWNGISSLETYLKASLKDVPKKRSINMRSQLEYEIVVPKHTKKYELQVTLD